MGIGLLDSFQPSLLGCTLRRLPGIQAPELGELTLSELWRAKNLSLRSLCLCLSLCLYLSLSLSLALSLTPCLCLSLPLCLFLSIFSPLGAFL